MTGILEKGMRKVVSGGQTGIDRAALDAALHVGLPIGGWCPAGRLAEDGVLHERYPLQEALSTDYAQRTNWNVRDSDGTLIIVRSVPEGGTALTIAEANRIGKPLRCVTALNTQDLDDTIRWIEHQGIGVLNVAGPRESESPGIYKKAREWLDILFHVFRLAP